MDLARRRSITHMTYCELMLVSHVGNYCSRSMPPIIHNHTQTYLTTAVRGTVALEFSTPTTPVTLLLYTLYIIPWHCVTHGFLYPE